MLVSNVSLNNIKLNPVQTKNEQTDKEINVENKICSKQPVFINKPLSFCSKDELSELLNNWRIKNNIKYRTLEQYNKTVNEIENEEPGFKEKVKNLKPFLTHTDFMLPNVQDRTETLISQQVALLNPNDIAEHGNFEVIYGLDGSLKYVDINVDF